MLDVKFIVAIAVGGLFAFMSLIGLFVAIYNKHKSNLRRRAIEQMYADSALARMDYDFALYDEDVARYMSVARQDGQLTIDDVMFDSALNSQDEPIEEITGNYNPD